MFTRLCLCKMSIYFLRVSFQLKLNYCKKVSFSSSIFARDNSVMKKLEIEKLSPFYYRQSSAYTVF